MLKQYVVDDIDKRIIDLLFREPLATNRALSKQVGLGELQVAARIKKLEQADMLRFIPVLDFLKTGYRGLANLWIDCEREHRDSIAQALICAGTDAHLNSMQGFAGQGGLEATFRYRTAEDIEDLLLVHLHKIDHIKSVDVTTTIKIYRYQTDHQPLSCLLRRMDVSSLTQELRHLSAKEKMDEVDIAIINEIQENGRVSSRKIANGMNVSEATIRNRINKIYSLGIMKIVAISDLKLSAPFCPKLKISVQPSRIHNIIGKIQSFGQKMSPYLAITTGRYNVTTHIMGDRFFIEDAIRSWDGVNDVVMQEFTETIYVNPFWQILN